MKNYSSLILITIPVICLNLVGCASSAGTATERFVNSRVELLKPGMTIIEIDSLFGKPTKSYTMDFGKETKHPWKGLVYEYRTVKDPNYKYNEQYKTNVFVFSSETDPPKLNHWKMEYSVDSKQEP